MAMHELESHYKKLNGDILIEIKLSNVMQLFNSLDPSPFREKDLDDSAEAYIVDTVREFPLKTPLRLVVYLPSDELTKAQTRALDQAVHHYFRYRAEVAQRQLRQTLKQGRVSLLIGLSFLFFCVTVGEVVAALGDGTFHHIVEEGLLISGWVAMWRPIQIFLYDWWPIVKTRAIYEKLTSVAIEARDVSTI